MRYTRVAEDLGIPAAVAQSNLAFGQELFAPMLSAMTEEQGQAWFNQAVPPDLTLAARSRSADWLYSYMKSFYRDPARPSGWNNTVFANVAMPHALHSLQGIQVLDEDGLRLASAGALEPAEYDIAVADLVNFLVYVAEPVAADPPPHRLRRDHLRAAAWHRDLHALPGILAGHNRPAGLNPAAPLLSNRTS